MTLLALLLPACTSTVGSLAPTHISPTRRLEPLPARFSGTVWPFTNTFAVRLRRTTWHPGCPVRLRDLRLLTLRYWGFDGRVHQGPMVVNALVANDVVRVFRRLFRARFPISDLHLANRYRPGVRDDPRSTADFTDGYNCRPVVTARGPKPIWSEHAYGLAIDINPLQNPYVAAGGYVYDVHARRYRNRSLHLPGMIHPGDVVVRAFAGIGWKWGGYWTGEKDYMHFSMNGH